MKSSRKKPWREVKTPDGIKIKYDFQDLTWGIKRKRATFNTVEEASAYHDALLKNAMTMAKGEKVERTFGEAMIEYIEQITAEGKLSLDSDLSDLMTLRWPFEYQGKFYRLEELPLHDRELGIVWGIKKYLQDLSSVVRRSYINKSIYHQRRGSGGLCWYEQPSPKDSFQPMARTKVQHSTIIANLEKAKGRGPFSKDTLRRRTSLAKTILDLAWHDWRWLNQNLSALIKLDKPGKGRIAWLTGGQFESLIEVSDQYFGYLIRGGKSIGWRQANLVGLTWDRVIFPEYLTNDKGERVKVPGYLEIKPFDKSAHDFDPLDLTQRRTRTKNKDKLETIMSPEIETLLREMQAHQYPGSNIVFHSGYGKYWGDYRKRWTTAKNRAGISAGFRWHDLRHTWATDRINEGVQDNVIMAEQGWKDREMVNRYGHLNRETRYEALKKAAKS